MRWESGWGAMCRAPSAPAVIHGDYHLDNTLASKDQPEILAIIDWELATVGDCYLDVALMLMFWGDYRTQDAARFQCLAGRFDGARACSVAANWRGAGRETRPPAHHMNFYMALGLLAIGGDYRGRLWTACCRQARF